MFGDWVLDIFDVRDLYLAHTSLQERLACNYVHLKQVADSHKYFQLLLVVGPLKLLPSLSECLRHGNTHGYLNEPEAVSVLAADMFSELYAFLQVKIDLVLLWFCSKGEPSRHSIVLKLLVSNLFLVEFKHSFKLVHEDVCVPNGHCLGLIGIMDVHQVNSLESQILSRLLKLMFKVIRVHAMNTCSDILFCYQVLI